MSNVNTSIRIPEETMEKIKAVAKENKRSVNYIINEIIDKFLEGQTAIDV